MNLSDLTSTVMSIHGSAIWTCQDLRPLSLTPDEYAAWRQDLEITSQQHALLDKVFVSISPDMLGKLSLTERALYVNRALSDCFDSMPTNVFGRIQVNYLWLLMESFSLKQHSQRYLNNLVNEIIQMSAHDVVILMPHDYRSQVTGMLDMEFKKHEKAQHWRPQIYYEMECEDSCKNQLAETPYVPSVVFLKISASRIPELCEHECSYYHIVFLVDEKDIALSKMANKCDELISRFPSVPIKIRLRNTFSLTQKHEVELLEYIVKTPQATFYNCGIQRLFASMSFMHTICPPCGMIDNVRIAIDLEGNLYPCIELVTPMHAIGNVFQDDIQSILARVTALHIEKYRECHESCYLVRACGGCFVIDCEFAERLFHRAIRSAKVCLDTALVKKINKVTFAD
jgi:radical SAM protein with 4Fe4S-binding SPASM domain